MGRGYDETREKGVYIVELEERAKLRFVPLDTPRFFDLEVDMGSQSPEDVLPPEDEKNFYRITLRGNLEESLVNLRQRHSAIANLEWIDLREEPVDLWENAGEDTLEGIYFRILREKLEKADAADAEQIRLAAEISRKILGGREVAL